MLLLCYELSWKSESHIVGTVLFLISILAFVKVISLFSVDFDERQKGPLLFFFLCHPGYITEYLCALVS